MHDGNIQLLPPGDLLNIRRKSALLLKIDFIFEDQLIFNNAFKVIFFHIYQVGFITFGSGFINWQILDALKSGT